MKQDTTYAYIVWKIRQYLDTTKDRSRYMDAYLSVIYMLYGMHKQYPVNNYKKDGLFFEYGDSLLENLSFIISNDNLLYDLYINLSNTSFEIFNAHYIKLISDLNDYISKNIDRRGDDFFTTPEISGLLGRIISRTNCKTLYDPFCGTASLIQYIDNTSIRFVGQDINRTVSLLARVNIEAHYGYDAEIKCIDSIQSWNNHCFDAVVSCPPFSFGFSEIQRARLKQEFKGNLLTLEEVFFRRAFSINQARYVISLVPFSFLYSQRQYNIREYLVKNNYLDTIITLPEKLLYGTSVSCALVICKRDRMDDEPIHFFDTKLYCSELFGKIVFDYEKFISDMERGVVQDVKTTSFDISVFNFNINPKLYNIQVVDYEKGQKLVRLGDLITQVKPVTDILPLEYDVIYGVNYMRNLISILKGGQKTKTITKTKEDDSLTSNRFYYSSNGETFLLCHGIELANMTFVLYTGHRYFKSIPGSKIYKINTDLVTPKYLIYLLLKDPVLSKLKMSIKDSEYISFVIDDINNQEKVIKKIESEYIRRAQEELEADLKRFGVKQNISDLEHMLGSTKIKIDNVISRLGRMDSSNTNYKETVKQLKDNVDYMFRVIHYNNSSMERESLNIGEYSLRTYLEEYSNAWTNYGGNYFTLSIDCEREKNIILKFDKAMFTVLLDSILSNAVRHGFHKDKNHTPNNRVEISVDVEIYKGSPYAVIRIANNGDSFNKGFTINDYITKGRYSANSGRSGLGGFHVYQITKVHNGYLYLDSNKVWNTIVEILIPANFKNTENYNEYEHECI